MNSKDRMVEVYSARGELEAQVIKGLLESNGIPSLLKSNAALSTHVFTFNGLGEVRVMVWESMAEAARKLIEGKDDV